MVKYFKFLWKKNAAIFTIILLMSSLIYGFGSKSQVDDFMDKIHSNTAQMEIAKEEPERYQQYYNALSRNQSELTNGEGDYFNHSPEEEIQKELDWYNENYNRLKKEAKNKPFTSENLKEYKEDARDFFTNYPDAIPYMDTGGSLSFLPDKDTYFQQENYTFEAASYYEKTLEYNSIYLAKNHFNMAIFAMAFLGIIYAVFLTSLEHMTKYKMFEEMIPLEGKIKYVTKLAFGIVWLAFYLILNTIIMFVLSSMATQGSIDISSLIQGYSQAGLQGIISFVLAMFVGSFTGNIVGHVAGMIPLSIGYLFFNSLYPLQDTLWRLIFSNIQNIDIRFYYPIISPIASSTMVLSRNQLFAALLLSLAAAIAGACLYKKAKYEDSGKFFTIKWINTLYYIFAVWTFASITAFISTGIVEGILTAVVFIISVLFFGYIFRFLFKVRIGF